MKSQRANFGHTETRKQLAQDARFEKSTCSAPLRSEYLEDIKRRGAAQGGGNIKARPRERAEGRMETKKWRFSTGKIRWKGRRRGARVLCATM